MDSKLFQPEQDILSDRYSSKSKKKDHKSYSSSQQLDYNSRLSKSKNKDLSPTINLAINSPIYDLNEKSRKQRSKNHSSDDESEKYSSSKSKYRYRDDEFDEPYKNSNSKYHSSKDETSNNHKKSRSKYRSPENSSRDEHEKHSRKYYSSEDDSEKRSKKSEAKYLSPRDDSEKSFMKSSSRYLSSEDEAEKKYKKSKSKYLSSDDETNKRNKKSKSKYRSSDDEYEKKYTKSKYRSSEDNSDSFHKNDKSSKSKTKSSNRSPSFDRNSPKSSAQNLSRDIYKDLSTTIGSKELEKKFVWKKKEKILKQSGLTKSEIKQRKLDLRKETEIELKKLQERRKLREQENILRDIEMARLQQEAEQEQLGDWKERENNFHLEQAKKRAEIRVNLNRPKPIDVLAINLKVATSPPDPNSDQSFDYNLDFVQPWKIVENLSLNDIEELYHEIQMYVALEKVPENLEFWKALMLICDSRRQRLMEIDSSTGVSKAVEEEIVEFLHKKSRQELDEIESEIRFKFESNLPIDSDYWEQVLKQMIVEKAKLVVNEYHNKVISNLLSQTRRKQKDDAIRNQQELAAILSKSKSLSLNTQENDLQKTFEDNPIEIKEEYSSDMEPTLVKSVGREDKKLEIYTQEEYDQILLKKRLQILKFEFITKKVEKSSTEEKDLSLAKELYLLEASKGLGSEEAVFSSEALIEPKDYLWQDKYKPRKPRYFNRVHAGYEWNKYNQTHYDFDNPPPKVVMGYKFNIFYPDLIDKSSAPTYRLEQDPEVPVNEDGSGKKGQRSRRPVGDTCIIRFIAGPPYEDIAFRVVNREWEYGKRHGFKNSFDRNVLQLHFKFARHFYRK
ncbi:Cactin [Smittium mucronatum]|uniref:Splicing factor Cactin n=1 Tax=Smittium mucronatum TaxID=133383 RepID=A0A1R0H0J8_9FUNG|nr:Cactin [Smittium mucronatum]